MPFLGFPNLYLMQVILCSLSLNSGARKEIVPGIAISYHSSFYRRFLSGFSRKKCHVRFIYCQIPLSQTSAMERFALCTDLISSQLGVNGDFSASSIK